MKNEIFPHTFSRPFLDCMHQLFFRPKYVWFPVHLKGPMIPDPSGQLAELIVYITSTRVDLYSHQILLSDSNKIYCALRTIRPVQLAVMEWMYAGLWTVDNLSTMFKLFDLHVEIVLNFCTETCFILRKCALGPNPLRVLVTVGKFIKKKSTLNSKEPTSYDKNFDGLLWEEMVSMLGNNGHVRW